MRLKTRYSVSLSSTSAEEEDICNIKPSSYEVSDALGEGSSRTYKVPDGTAGSVVDLAGLTEVSYLYVRTNKPITLNLNGSEAIPVAVPDGNDFGYLAMNVTGVTSLTVDNSSGATARVLVVLAGDPA